MKSINILVIGLIITWLCIFWTPVLDKHPYYIWIQFTLGVSIMAYAIHKQMEE